MFGRLGQHSDGGPPADADWLSLSTSQNLTSLSPGQSASVSLLLTPKNGLPLGEYRGKIRLSDSTGLTEDVAFSFFAVSETIGSLEVSVVDEFTYYAVGSPRVVGADVVILNYFTSEEVVRGRSDTHGNFNVERIPSGFYLLKVSESDHSSYSAIVAIEPGLVKKHEAFVSVQTVRYKWNVGNVDIQDDYQLTINSVFQTNVPFPVLRIENRAKRINGVEHLGPGS